MEYLDFLGNAIIHRCSMVYPGINYFFPVFDTGILP